MKMFIDSFLASLLDAVLFVAYATLAIAVLLLVTFAAVYLFWKN